MERPTSRPGRVACYRILWRLGAILLALIAALIIMPVFADEGHHGGGALQLTGGPFLWGVASLGGVFAFIILSRLMLLRRSAHQMGSAKGQTGYFAAIRQFSPNARLFLGYSLMAGLGSGIWAVMFNLYLLRMDFSVAFIGAFWFINMLCHGVSALPAGLIADRFGRRRAFFIATFVAMAAQGTLLFTVEPTAILMLAGVAGFGEAFHGVTGAPFMMENSEPRERPHLFSLNASFLQLSLFGGNLAGGLLPLAWAGLVGVPDIDPAAARWALVSGLPLTIMALVPLAFMREKKVELVESLRDLVTLRNVVNFGVIAKLTLLGLMTGAGFGLTIRFFNVFFEDVHAATDSQIGTILGLGALASGASVLVSPLVAQRWGKVKGIVLSQAASVPFLLLMAMVPSLSVVTAMFMVRGALYGVAGPLRNQLSMEFVTARERGTTAGFTHTAFDLGGGVGAGIAGLVLADGGFITAFSFASMLIMIPALLYYLFFARMETREPVAAPAPAAAGASR